MNDGRGMWPAGCIRRSQLAKGEPFAREAPAPHRRKNDSPRVASMTPTRGESFRPGRVGISQAVCLGQTTLSTVIRKARSASGLRIDRRQAVGLRRLKKQESSQDLPSLHAEEADRTDLPTEVQKPQRLRERFGGRFRSGAFGRQPPFASCDGPTLPLWGEPSIESGATLQ